MYHVVHWTKWYINVCIKYFSHEMSFRKVILVMSSYRAIGARKLYSTGWLPISRSTLCTKVSHQAFLTEGLYLLRFKFQLIVLIVQLQPIVCLFEWRHFRFNRSKEHQRLWIPACIRHWSSESRMGPLHHTCVRVY